MMRVEAIIRPTKLDEVECALHDLGISGFTAARVMGAGRGCAKSRHYLTAEYLIALLDSVKLEMTVPDNLVETVLDAVAGAAFTGETGDGTLLVSRVDDAMCIRTRQRGERAL